MAAADQRQLLLADPVSASAGKLGVIHSHISGPYHVFGFIEGLRRQADTDTGINIQGFSFYIEWM